MSVTLMLLLLGAAIGVALTLGVQHLLRKYRKTPVA